MAAITIEPIPKEKHSKRYKPEDLPIGTPVFYREERWFIEFCPETWERSTHVILSSHRVHRDKFGDWVAPEGRRRFAVFPDLLELAPTPKTPYAKAPTYAAVKAKELREKLGVKDAGDPVAEALRDKTLDEVYMIAAKYLGESEEQLRSKYGHLNNGQQRMNCGNRMRGMWKKTGAPVK